MPRSQCRLYLHLFMDNKKPCTDKQFSNSKITWTNTTINSYYHAVCKKLSIKNSLSLQSTIHQKLISFTLNSKTKILNQSINTIIPLKKAHNDLQTKFYKFSAMSQCLIPLNSVRFHQLLNFKISKIFHIKINLHKC
mgnify:CR=1 FL=1